MVKKLEIKNFKNIKEASYSFDEMTSILAGQNGIGKSNTLNALMWLLCETLLTDSTDIIAKGDMDSIIPLNAPKRTVVEVKITLDDDSTFAKRYKETYKRGTDIVNGHTTEYVVNDVAMDNATKFNEKLYKHLNYQPAFTSLKVKELNLFVDPLYALQKLDEKELRKVLVALGCSVTNEELYASGFEDLRQYEAQYDGEWDVMKKNVKKQADKHLADDKVILAQLEQYNDVEEFNDARLNELKGYRSELEEDKAKLKITSEDELVKNKKLELKQYELELQSLINTRRSEIKIEIETLKGQKKLEYERLDDKNAEQEHNAKVLDIKNQIYKLKVDLMAYEKNANAHDLESKKLINEAQSNAKEQNNLVTHLDALIHKEYEDVVVCPNCGNAFNRSEEDAQEFYAKRNAEIEKGKLDLSNLKTRFSELKGLVENEKKLYIDCMNSATETKEKISKLEHTIEELKLAYENKIKTMDLSRISKLEKRIEELQEQYNNVAIEFKENYNHIAQVNEEIARMMNDKATLVKDAINGLEMKLIELEKDIDAEVIKRSRWLTKVDLNAKHESIISEFNDANFLYGRVKAFTDELTKRLNALATQKLGIDFVMLEDNLTNDGTTEVCYALVNGIPFKQVNTSEKIKFGIKFIEKIKDIAVDEFGVLRNSLPILADKLESFDSVQKIKSLTKEQLIGTRVAENEKIEIL